MSIAAGIVMMNKFISPGDKRYQGAIDYLDKEKSKRMNNLDKFDAFKENYKEQLPIRMTALFDARQDALDQESKQRLKEDFLKARAKKSPMWQTVFSFDNEFLEELGLYRMGQHDFIDEAAIREATRTAMNKLTEDFGLGQTAEWTGAIHFDTDNIHVHIMTVSTDPASVLKTMTYKGKEVYRAKIPPKVQRGMKSKFGNAIANRDPSLARISFLLRTELVQTTLDKGYGSNLHVMRGISQLLNVLPKDRRTWFYGNQIMAEHRERLDGLAREILQMNNPKGLQELDNLLTEQSDFYLKAYGQEAVEGNNGKTYKENQYETLYKNFGNALLKELRTMVGIEEWKEKNAYTPEDIERYIQKMRASKVNKQMVDRLASVLEETKQDYLNKLSYQREVYRKERERQYNLEQDTGRDY